MKKLVLGNLGGMPSFQEDLQVMQDAYSESLFALCNALAPDVSKPTVFSGCVISNISGGKSISAGVIAWNGELFTVDALSITGSGTVYFQIVTTYLDLDPVSFENGDTNSVHSIRKLSPTFTNPSSNGFDSALLQTFESPKAIKDSLTTLINGINTTLTNAIANTVLKGELRFLAQMNSNASLNYFDTDGIGHGVYSGWAFADGRAGRVDCRDQFIMATATVGQITNTGGNATVKLVPNQVPQMTVEVTQTTTGKHGNQHVGTSSTGNVCWTDNGGGDQSNNNITDVGTFSGTVGTATADQASFSILPPYFKAVVIQRIV